MTYLAFCGLLCDQCPLYIATRADDPAEMERLAVEYSTPEVAFAPADMRCEGCFSSSADDSKVCGECDIRACAKGNTVQNCGVCAQYPCDIIVKRLPPDTEYRSRLDEIAAGNSPA